MTEKYLAQLLGRSIEEVTTPRSSSEVARKIKEYTGSFVAEVDDTKSLIMEKDRELDEFKQIVQEKEMDGHCKAIENNDKGPEKLRKDKEV